MIDVNGYINNIDFGIEMDKQETKEKKPRKSCMYEMDERKKEWENNPHNR